MVMAGIPPARALVAATRTSAEILGQDDLGMVAPGKSADFVVLDANPLDDITNTRRIDRVYLRGQAGGQGEAQEGMGRRRDGELILAVRCPCQVEGRYNRPNGFLTIATGVSA